MTGLQSTLARAAEGGRISPEEALELYKDAPFHALGRAADAARRARFGDTAQIATYLIDRNINYTNVCVTACKFCAFYRAPKHAEGWTHPLEEILRRCAEAVDLGATQIMLQGGHNPELGIEWYEQTFSAIRAAYPALALHSLGGSEVVHIARTSGIGFEEVISRLHAAGLDSFAGAGAEILTQRPRDVIAPLKEPGAVWLQVMETAHGLGVESTATFMMGTGETNAERIEHLRLIRDVQDRTGGFRSFIPWTYQPENNHLRGPHAGHLGRVSAAARGCPAVLRQHRASPGFPADTGKGGRPARPALRRRRPGLGDAGGERGLLRRGAAQVEPAGADPSDPHRRPGACPARHALPPPPVCTGRRPTTLSPTTGSPSHYASNATGAARREAAEAARRDLGLAPFEETPAFSTL